jgi:hypothetical protein
MISFVPLSYAPRESYIDHLNARSCTETAAFHRDWARPRKPGAREAAPELGETSP